MPLPLQGYWFRISLNGGGLLRGHANKVEVEKVQGLVGVHRDTQVKAKNLISDFIQAAEVEILYMPGPLNQDNKT